ncbi:MAG: insulinase family protein [Marinilabiliales bacterium]
MNKIVFVLLFGILSVNLFSQVAFKDEDQLPMDPELHYGKLDNGVTYYVKHNSEPKNRAELTLIVRAGSVFEDEDQRGLAHFCEHMAFNGTKNFPKHELINYLESIGMKFGPEVNAYTSFDETVYGIKIPLDSMEYLDKGLLVLYDWAFNVSYEDEEIDKERGVIHEEWRMNQGAQFRMMEKMFPVLFKGSKYAERLPIGLMSVVDSCEHETLRRFYHDWYRPDLIAVVAVGDFDASVVEEKIKSLFSKHPKPENPRKAVTPEIPDHTEPLVSIVSDKEAQASSVQIFYKHPLWIQKTHKDYRTGIIHELYNSMINARLQELTLTEDPPFVYGYSAYTNFLGPKDVYMSIAATAGDKIMKGLEALMVENQRAKKYGFTQTELDRQKKALMRQVEKIYNERDKTKSQRIVEEIKANFLLTQKPIPGIEYEYELYKHYIDGITLEEVNELASQWITDENMVVLINAPEKEDVVLPTVDDVKKKIEEVKNMDIEPYVDKVSDKPFFAEEITPGKITAKEKNKEQGYEKWTLSNGINVIIKPTDFKEDEILMYAYSWGGTSLYPLEQDVSARIATDIIQESGISEFDKVELEKILSDKVLRINPFINELSEGFQGSCAPKDFETLLQMVYFYFNKLRYDKIAYNSYITRMKSMYENQSLSPENAFRDTIQATLSQNHPKKRPMSDKLLDEADYKTVYKIFKERFGDPSNFTFIFVGNINLKEAKGLIEKYLGSLPKVGREETWKDNNINPPLGKVDKTVYKGKDPKSIVFMDLHGDFDYNWKNYLLLDAVCKVLSTKLLETIREDKSGVYSIGAYPQFKKYPKSRYSVVIYFGCSPDNVDNLTDGVFEEIKKLKENGPTPEDLNKVKEKLLREYETNVRENKWWLNMFKNSLMLSMNMQQYLSEYNDFVNGLTNEKLKDAANKYLDDTNYIRIVLKPETEKN